MPLLKHTLSVYKQTVTFSSYIVWQIKLVLIAMTAYTLLECIVEGGFNAGEVFTHHIIPAVLVAVFIWVAIHFFFRRMIVKPISQICKHLNKVSNGQLSTLEVSSEISEIKKIVWCINILTTKLKEAPAGYGLKNSVDDVMSLRANLQTLAEDKPDTLEDLVPSLVALEDLEKNLLAACMFEVTRSRIKS